MEKKEMSFIEKFEKASEELEKAKGDKCHMLTFAVDDESEKICASINATQTNSRHYWRTLPLETTTLK